MSAEEQIMKVAKRQFEAISNAIEEACWQALSVGGTIVVVTYRDATVIYPKPGELQLVYAQALCEDAPDDTELPEGAVVVRTGADVY